MSDLAHEIGCRVREVEGKSALETDCPLGADIREANRIARRLADHYLDSEVRRIYRQHVERIGGKGTGSRGLDPAAPSPR